MASKPVGKVNPDLQRTSSRAEKEWVGERRRASEVSLGDRGQGHVRPEEETEKPQNVMHCFLVKTNETALNQFKWY